MPVRVVTMSSRDPAWMTPLVKVMLRQKTKLSDEVRLKELNERISEVIGENRRQYHLGAVGSRDWWKGVDSVSQRRNSAHIMLDHESLENLNDYFCKLCTDDNYVQPSDVQICTDVKVPTISERQVWNALSNLKRTATGPDRIPFWIWREHAELLTPVITHIWNLSLSTHSLPQSWKRANINPPPKVDVPRENSDFHGISVTPVIARALERAVYNIHVRRVMEDSLSATQFAYREGGNCTGALLTIQHQVCKYLDDSNCKAV